MDEGQALFDRLKRAVFMKGMGLSLTDREIRALYKTIEGVLVDDVKYNPAAPGFSGTELKCPTFEDSLDSILSELRSLMISKQRDYGPRNILNCGEKGVAVRANDKMARLLNLHGISDGSYQAKAAKNESIEDSWKDLANYGMIALMVRRGIFDRPLRNPS